MWKRRTDQLAVNILDKDTDDVSFKCYHFDLQKKFLNRKIILNKVVTSLFQADYMHNINKQVWA
jgi:hypothetical protein